MIRYLLMLILFSATGATGAFINKAPPSLLVQRQLVWSVPDVDTPCDAATIAKAQQLIDPFIESCLESWIQWDPDSILNMMVHVFFSFSPVASYSIYYPIYDGNKLCQSGYSSMNFTGEGIDLSPDNLYDLDRYPYDLYDEYMYDCSNVYCGSNAIRDAVSYTHLTLPTIAKV